jgi:RNA polymerase sigma-70 factor
LTLAHQPDAPLTGATLGQYRIISRLAGGRMADLWLAAVCPTGSASSGGHEEPHRVVLKTMLPAVAESDELVRMFVTEAVIGSQLCHPNLVQVLEYGQLAGRYFIAMEYIDGMTLRQLGQRTEELGQVFPQWLLLSVTVDVCRGLHAAHELRDRRGPLQFVHRDVSPENIMVSRAGAGKVIDFGAALTLRVSQDTRFLGKFRYVAPERVLGQAGDRRVDVYALGVILYEYLTGMRPFQGDELAVVSRIMEGRPRPPAELVPGLDPELNRITLKALAFDPEQRYPTAAALAADLLTLVQRPDSAVAAEETRQLLRRIFDPRLHDRAREAPPGRSSDEEQADSRPVELVHTLSDLIRRTRDDARVRRRMRTEEFVSDHEREVALSLLAEVLAPVDEDEALPERASWQRLVSWLDAAHSADSVDARLDGGLRLLADVLEPATDEERSRQAASFHRCQQLFPPVADSEAATTAPPARLLEPRAGASAVNLDGIYADARRAWPGIELDEATFLDTLLDRMGPEQMDPRTLHFADLYLACACMHRVSGAVEALDRRYLARLAPAIRSIDPSPAFLDEVTQVLRAKLFMDSKLASYSGRGSLESWVAVAAHRVGLSLKRRQRNDHELSDNVAVHLLPEDPELAYLKAQYRHEFQAALTAALAGLSERQQIILRLTLVKGVSHDRIAAIYGVNQSTVTRWVSATRQQVQQELRAQLADRLRMDSGEVDSLVHFMKNDPQLSISHALERLLD